MLLGRANDRHMQTVSERVRAYIGFAKCALVGLVPLPSLAGRSYFCGYMALERPFRNRLVDRQGRFVVGVGPQ